MCDLRYHSVDHYGAWRVNKSNVVPVLQQQRHKFSTLSLEGVTMFDFVVAYNDKPTCALERRLLSTIALLDTDLYLASATETQF